MFLQMMSPAMKFLQMIWKHEGYQMGHSWRRLNQSMRQGLHLAITAGLRFDPDDAQIIVGDPRDGGFNGRRWIGENGNENCYSLACANNEHRQASPSAIKMIEKWLNRKPWLLHHRQGNPTRLCVGAQIAWPPAKDAKMTLEVTSFGKNDTMNLAQREYQEQHGRCVIVKRFKVTREQLAEVNRPFLEANRAVAKVKRQAKKQAEQAEKEEEA